MKEMVTIGQRQIDKVTSSNRWRRDSLGQTDVLTPTTLLRYLQPASTRSNVGVRRPRPMRDEGSKRLCALWTGEGREHG